MENPNQIVETYNDFEDLEDFAAHILEQEVDLTTEAKHLFLAMARLAHRAFFDEDVYHPDFEAMHNARGACRWHRMRNGRQCFVFCIAHNIFQPGQQQPSNAFFNLRVYANIYQADNPNHEIHIIAEDNLNRDVDGDFSFFFQNTRVLANDDILPLFDIWLHIPRQRRTINEIRNDFQDKIGKYDFQKKYESAFTGILLTRKPPVRTRTRRYPWITELSPEVLKIVHQNGQSDLSTQSVYNFGRLPRSTVNSWLEV